MNDEKLKRHSKFLALVLRHRPELAGVSLGPGGWVAVEALLAGLARAGHPLSRADLDEVVARNNKQRFAYSEDGARIRASQGHSVEVDLGLDPVEPPALLYHGTGHQSAEAIAREGLRPMSRHHVHLSADIPTARAVGARHGRPVIFAVDAAAMAAAGHRFYCSANGVWLADEVPARYLSRLADGPR